MQIFVFLVYKLCLHIAKAAEEMEFFIVVEQPMHLQRSRWPGNSKFVLFCFKTENAF